MRSTWLAIALLFSYRAVTMRLCRPEPYAEETPMDSYEQPFATSVVRDLHDTSLAEVPESALDLALARMLGGGGEPVAAFQSSL
ncbi:FxSxx-COOH cyclophane-containing RiPP peptide [Streptomyces sp. NPDC101112]|uniref:FxSxx-COOH cyclophane-containing RiPP peptide n=1 Tax=Streptomyces sp. NPDC101112 TaxID=3366105 RepID=UPI003809BEE9